MVASEQLAALNAQQHITSDRAERIEYALAEADALIAAAGGQDGGADPGHWHRVAMRQVDEIDGLNAKCADLERNIARLRAENSALEASRHLHATNGETLYARAERAEREVADLQAKLDEAARLAREAAVEAMHIAGGKTCVWADDSSGVYSEPSCCDDVWAYAFRFKFCPNCGGEIVKGGE